MSNDCLVHWQSNLHRCLNHIRSENSNPAKIIIRLTISVSLIMICSPNQVTIMLPAVKKFHQFKEYLWCKWYSQSLSRQALNPAVIPTDWTNASTRAMYRVAWFNFLRPTPCLPHSTNLAQIHLQELTMIEADGTNTKCKTGEVFMAFPTPSSTYSRRIVHSKRSSYLHLAHGTYRCTDTECQIR